MSAMDGPPQNPIISAYLIIGFLVALAMFFWVVFRVWRWFAYSIAGGAVLGLLPAVVLGVIAAISAQFLWPLMIMLPWIVPTTRTLPTR